MQRVQIAIPQEIFQKDPSNITAKIGGTELPVDYLDFNFDFFPQFKNAGKNAILRPEHGGVYCFYKVYRFPTKGIPGGPALELIGIIKKIILNTLKVLNSSPIRYFVGLFQVLPKSIREKSFYYSLGLFLEICDWCFNRWYLEPDRMTTCCREIYFKGCEFINYTFEEKDPQKKDILKRLLYVFCMIIEYDSAYRCRLQDLAPLIDKEALRKNPRKELNRVLKEIIHRESVAGLDPKKYDPFLKLVNFMLILKKKTSQTLIDFICCLDLSEIPWEEFKNTDFTNPPLLSPVQRVGRDHADWYHILNAESYGYGSIPFYARYRLRKEIDRNWADQMVKEGIIKVDKDGRVIEPK